MPPEVTPASITKAGLDPEKATPEQKARVEAIELAVGCLGEGKVPFILLASPDSPSEQMKVIQGNRLSYATDLPTITKETALSRQAILWAALKTLSIGMRGALAVIDVDGNPIAVFDSGEAIALEREAKDAGKVVTV